MSADGAMEGGCRCGQVRFRVTGRPLLTMACHCTGCQRMTGGAFSLSSAYPGDRFEVIAGEPAIGGLHGSPRHFHCPHCMSWMFTRLDGPDVVNVRTTMLDSVPDAPPFVESFTSEALPWARTGARHSFPQFPAMEQFQPLIAEYAATAAT
jgi:hypothetical protein